MKTEDTISIPMKVLTLDWGRAAKVKVLVTFVRRVQSKSVYVNVTVHGFGTGTAEVSVQS